MPGELAVVAYGVPALFGLGVYLQFWTQPRRLEAAAVAWALGWAAVNLVSFLANQYLTVPLDERFYVGLGAPLAAVGGFLVARNRGRLAPLLKRPFLPQDLKQGPGLALLGLFGGFCVFVLYESLIIFPVHADELIYHMELPKIAWETGFLPLRPGLDLFGMATAYPDLLVTQQLWVYLGAGAFDPCLVRVVPAIYTALLIMLVLFDARRWFGLATAGLAAAVLLSLYSFTSLTILLMDEVPVAFYSYLALRFAFDALRSGGPWHAAGLFAGLSALVKYDGLLALLALGIALLLVYRWKPHPADHATAKPTWVSGLRRMAAYFAFAVPATLPLLLRNGLDLGNPIYPYFFGGVDSQLSPILLAQFAAPAVIVEIWSSEFVSVVGTVAVAGIVLGLLRHREWTAPEGLVLLMIVLYLPPYLVYPLIGSQIRYLAPILPGIALFAGRQLDWLVSESARRPRFAGIALLLSLAGLTAAIATWAPFYSNYERQIAWVVAATFAISAVLVSVFVIARLLRGGSHLRRVATYGVVLVLLVPGVVAVADEQWEPNPFGGGPVLLPQSQGAYLSERIGPDWAMWQWMNANLPANASVLSFEPRTFYLDAHIVSALSPAMMPMYNMTLSASLGFAWSYGIRYVLDSPFGDSIFFNNFYVGISPIFQNLGNRSAFTPMHQEGGTVLYLLRQPG